MKRRAGFTLLEMMVVLAIGALIIGIGVGAVRGLSDEHELRKASLAVEQVFMQATHRAYATSSSQIVAFDEQGLTLLGPQPQSGAANPRALLPKGARLQLGRMGADKLVPAAGQRVLLRPGGLCEPLTLRFDWQGCKLSATLDPLTGGLLNVEESFPD